jgi:uncharacterized protein YebE (UPF0316 family)
MEPILAGLYVFFMRLMDMSLDTIRLLFMMRGRKLLAGLIGATQAAVFILAVSAVLSGPLNVFTVVGYALGFGAGVVVGMFAEERMALGYAMLRAYSPSSGREIALALRQAGYAATEIEARGKDGRMTVVNAVVARRDVLAVRRIVDSVDASTFITVDEERALHGGFFRR